MAAMSDGDQLPDSVELVKSDIFWPEGRFYFCRGEFVWSKTEDWQKYYEVNRDDCHFKTAEEAMQAWESSKH